MGRSRLERHLAARVLLVAAGLLLAASCSGVTDPAPAPTFQTNAIQASPTAEPPPIEFGGAPLPMDLIDCDALLTEAEVEAVLQVDVTPIGRRASSCYWVVGDGIVQLVFNTSDVFPRWREALLQTYTRGLTVTDFEAWAASGSESIAAFGPGRGLIVHGVRSQPQALDLLRVALPRLGDAPLQRRSAGP